MPCAKPEAVPPSPKSAASRDLIMGVTEQSFYRWKRKFAGLGIAELRRLKLLEEENRKLKALVADLSLDKHMLQEVIAIQMS